jgi:hypothetical protein
MIPFLNIEDYLFDQSIGCGGGQITARKNGSTSALVTVAPVASAIEKSGATPLRERAHDQIVRETLSVIATNSRKYS